jgi:hypothetical protein
LTNFASSDNKTDANSDLGLGNLKDLRLGLTSAVASSSTNPTATSTNMNDYKCWAFILLPEKFDGVRVPQQSAIPQESKVSSELTDMKLKVLKKDDDFGNYAGTGAKKKKGKKSADAEPEVKSTVKANLNWNEDFNCNIECRLDSQESSQVYSYWIVQLQPMDITLLTESMINNVPGPDGITSLNGTLFYQCLDSLCGGNGMNTSVFTLKKNAGDLEAYEVQQKLNAAGTEFLKGR